MRKPNINLKIRKSLPKALRQQVWIKYYGTVYYENKCFVDWCKNIITPFNFEVGHNIPYSKSGTDNIDNLRPICSQCNKSMGNNYTIDEFIELGCNKMKNSESKKENKLKKLTSSFNLPCCFHPSPVNE